VKTNQVKQSLGIGFGIYFVLHLSFTNKIKNNKQYPTTTTIPKLNWTVITRTIDTRPLTILGRYRHFYKM